MISANCVQILAFFFSIENYLYVGVAYEVVFLERNAYHPTNSQYACF